MAKHRKDRAARAASLMVDAIDGAQLSGQRWLVVEEPGDAVPRALAAAGAEVVRWSRFWSGATPGFPEPPAGAFDRVAVRQPRGRDALDLALHLAGARLEAGAPLWLYGHNDEGARSVGRALPPLFEAVESVDARRHSRLWSATRSAAPALGRLVDHARTVELDLSGEAVPFTVFPGVFAKGQLDPGTRLLHRALSRLELPRVRAALDFACGFGAVAAWLRRRWPEAVVHGCDADAVAVEAARASVPGASFAGGDRWGGLASLEVPAAGYDLIASNPPLHRGRDLDLGVLVELVRGARRHLAKSGRLVLVVQSQRPLRDLLVEHVGKASLLAEDGRYRVWEARAGERERRTETSDSWTIGSDPPEWLT